LSESLAQPIGGYFELDLGKSGKLPYANTLQFQSARAAFLALLRAVMPKRVWIPKYICDAMPLPLQTARVEYVWYDLDLDLAVDGKIRLLTDDILIYVNYFGLQTKNAAGLFNRFPARQILLDYSQAFFEPPSETALGTLYSPRRFFGVPDGGLLSSKLVKIPSPEQRAESLCRSAHLFKKPASSAGDAYPDDQHTETILCDYELRWMSKLTECILCARACDGATNARRANFLQLHRAVRYINQFQIDWAKLRRPCVTRSLPKTQPFELALFPENSKFPGIGPMRLTE
jgi:hypothetical protein